MPIKTALGAFAMVCALLATGLATVPLIISHQGRLLDGADQPVSGSVSMTFSLYEAPTGGVALASETQLVVVEDGLFSVQLSGLVGSTGLPDVPELWLGRQVGADTELLPRLRVGSVPYAMTATRMQGDIETSPGRIAIGDVDDADNAVIESSTGQSIFFLKDSNASGEASLRGVVSGLNPGTSNISALYLDIDDDGDGTPVSTVVLSAQVEDADNDAGCDLTMQFDEDDDGVPEADVSSYARKNGAIIACNYNYKEMSRMSATPDTAKIEIHHDDDADGIAESSIQAKTHPNGGTFDASATGGGTTGRAVLTVTPSDGLTPDQSLADLILSADVDGDSIPDVSASSYARKNGAIIACDYNYKSSSRMVATLDSGVMEISHDADNDGFHQCKSTCVADESTISCGLARDIDDDGTPDVTIDQDCDDTDASLRIRKVDATTGITTSIEQTCDATGAMHTLSGMTDSTKSTLALSTAPGGGYIAIAGDWNDDGADTFQKNILATCDPTSARIRIMSNADQDLRGAHELSSSSTGVSHSFHWDSDNDGIMDRTIDDDCNDISASRGIKVQNVATGLNNSIDQDCDDVSARIKVANSDASSGSVVVKGSWDASSSSAGVSHRFAWDSNLDGVADRTIDDDCNDEGSEMGMTAGTIPNFIRLRARDTGGIPGGGSDARMVMGHGTDSLIEIGSDGSSSLLRFRAATPGTIENTLQVTGMGSNFTMTNILGVVSLDLNGDGRIGLGGTADASDPIHHISGAHLSAAGDWVNASDKNAKENFSEVDGAEILEKIEDLNISEWNYKAQDEDVRHIGPTAQDFKSVFGVGDDDKSISTIDPSGIALAAIKELYSQLKAKDKQIEELQSEMSKLRKEVSEKK